LTSSRHFFWFFFSQFPQHCITTASSSSHPDEIWNADKVHKVLEGKAVVHVVNIDQLLPVLAAAVSSAGRRKGQWRWWKNQG
jgi:hypothetical protein